MLTEEEIESYFSSGSRRSIQDILRSSKPGEANIVILNLGTGSFLDIVTRHGSLTLPSIFGSIKRDVRGISEILEFIQHNNRKNHSHTQVYLCGAPRVMNTFVTDLALNSVIKKMGSEYANVTYVPSFPRQAFYKTSNGTILPDPHYNHAEYYHLLNEIEQNIINHFFVRDLLIDMDIILYQLSLENDLKGSNYGESDALDVIQEMAKKYQDRDGSYDYFLDLAKK